MPETPSDKLKKLQAVMTDRSATTGEKTAAKAAAERIRTRLERERVAKDKAAIAGGNAAYLLGRALGRARQGGGKAGSTGKSVMFALGKALSKATKKT